MRTIERTLIALREDGHEADVVERSVGGRRTYIRKDFLGLIDIIAIEGTAIVGIQCGGDSDHAEHIRKALASDKLLKWLGTEAKFEVWSWGRRAAYKKNGERAKIDAWTLRIQQVVREGEKLVAMPAFTPKLLSTNEILSTKRKSIHRPEVAKTPP